MLKLLDSDDKLAIVLGHEMAHAVARHAAEQMSFRKALFAFDAILTTVAAFLVPVELFAPQVERILHTLRDTFIVPLLFAYPYSRMLESEADRIGLLYAAKACYNPSAGPVVWQEMAARDPAGATKLGEFFSTHPAHDSRIEDLRGWLAEAEEERKKSHCRVVDTHMSRFRQLGALLRKTGTMLHITSDDTNASGGAVTSPPRPDLTPSKA
eukprot:Opistho-2@23422